MNDPPHRAILAIALPAMLTNVAVAAVGLADVWVIGRLGQADLQAAVEIGAKLIFFVAGLSICLRFGTTGLTAQAAGTGDTREQAAILARALALALLFAGLAGALRWVVVPAGIRALGAHGSVAAGAAAYLALRYWALPAAIVNTTLSGWLIGRRSLRAVLAVEIGYNVLHIALALWLVARLGWSVRGVAAASLFAEWVKLAVLGGIVAASPPARRLRAVVADAATWTRTKVVALLRLNRDLFVRTLVLLVSIMIFTRAGAAQASVVLAANAVLWQLFIVGGMILDGFEAAAQVLGGEAYGARDGARFARLTWHLLGWMTATALILGIAYAAGGDALTGLFSRDPQVVAALGDYRPWLIVLPLLASASFVFDGLFIGASWTRAMLVSMAWSFAAFAAALWLTRGVGNHALWGSYALTFVVRGGVQAWLLRGLMARSFALPASRPSL